MANDILVLAWDVQRFAQHVIPGPTGRLPDGVVHAQGFELHSWLANPPGPAHSGSVSGKPS